MSRKTSFTAIAAVLLLAGATAVYAAGTSSSSWGMQDQNNGPAVSLYDQGVEATQNNDFQKALGLFKQALQRDRNNPDILNMLAHTQLKLGMIEESLESYKKALSLRPKFAEAREYLGEAYIQAALREVGTLKSYGAEAGGNLDTLKKAIKDAAATLE